MTRMRQVGAYLKVDLIQIVRNWYWSVPPFLIMPIYYLVFARLVRAEDMVEVTFGFVGLAVFATAVFQLSSQAVMQRTEDFAAFLRTMPAPMWVRFASRVLIALMMSFFLALSIIAAGRIFLDLTYESTSLLRLPVIVIFAVVVFAPLGTCIGYLVPPQASQTAAVLLFLTVAVGSGLFTGGVSPISIWWIRELIPLRLVQGFSHALAAGDPGGLAWSLLVGTEWALLSLAIATVAYRRSERKRLS